MMKKEVCAKISLDLLSFARDAFVEDSRPHVKWSHDHHVMRWAQTEAEEVLLCYLLNQSTTETR